MIFLRRPVALASAVIALLSGAALPRLAAAATLPPGFTDTRVAGGQIEVRKKQ